ncbi:MAG: hypothetical protein M3069_12650 [Chloroflexota bacterium]|nr:hypothetical protein [Chloroflexota bacterium]
MASNDKDPRDPSAPPVTSGSPTGTDADPAKSKDASGQKESPKHGDKERPAGKSDTSDVTGVDPKKIITGDRPAG